MKNDERGWPFWVFSPSQQTQVTACDPTFWLRKQPNSFRLPITNLPGLGLLCLTFVGTHLNQLIAIRLSSLTDDCIMIISRPALSKWCSMLRTTVMSKGGWGGIGGGQGRLGGQMPPDLLGLPSGSWRHNDHSLSHLNAFWLIHV